MTGKELRQKRAGLIAQMHECADGEWSSERRERWERLNADQAALEVQITVVEKSEGLSAEMRSFTAPSQRQPGEFVGAHRERSNRLLELRSSPEYSDAFTDYCRSGQANPQLEEVRAGAQLTETTTGGGYLIPVGFQKELEIKLKAIGPMLAQCRVITTATGNNLQWPTWDDTSNSGEWLAINSDATSGAAPTFGQVTFISNVASSKQVLVPVQLLADSAFDLQAELSDAFAIRIGRCVNLAFTSGPGTTAPAGLLTDSLGTSVTNIISATGDTGTGHTDLNSVGIDDLSNLIAALDPAYRVRAKFMANQSTFDALRKIKDTLGRPLWVSSITQGQPDTIYGYPFFFNQNTPAIGAGLKSVAFGDFSKYVIRQVLGITFIRFNELYMGSYNVGFQAYLRCDGQCIQPAAFAVLRHPLS